MKPQRVNVTPSSNFCNESRVPDENYNEISITVNEFEQQCSQTLT